MSVSNRIESLYSRHEELEKQLHEEEIRPHPNDQLVTKLKREKLALKDELSHLDA